MDRVAPSPPTVGDAGPTVVLASFVARLRWPAVDAVTRETTLQHVLDIIGAALAGSTNPVIEVMRNAVRGIMPAGDHPVPGDDRGYDTATAAYLFAGSAHGLEIDDGFNAGAVHPGCVIVAAAFELALAQDIRGADFLTAIVAGYEVSCRVAACGHPATTRRGFHNTGIVGTLGAAAACAHLLRLSPDGVANTLGIAASASSGLFSFSRGGDAKRTHPAHAAREGMLAALLALKGLVGPPDILEQENGWFRAFAGDATIGVDIRTAGGNHPQSQFAIANSYIKPFGCCRHVQSSVDLALELRERHAIDPGQIDRIDIRTYALACVHGAIGWSSESEARLSFPYIIATVLVHGGLGPDSFAPDRLGDPVVAHLARRIRVESDETCERGYPAGNPTRIAIRLSDGRIFEGARDHARGGAQAPLSQDEIENKFRSLAASVVPAERIEDIIEQVRDLPKAASLHPLGRLLGQAPNPETSQ